MVQIANRLIRMSAVNDAYKPRIIAHQLRFIGTGLNVGDFLRCVDNFGDVITEHYVTAIIEDQVILGTGVKLFINGLQVTSMPSGTAELQIHLL